MKQMVFILFLRCFSDETSAHLFYDFCYAASQLARQSVSRTFIFQFGAAYHLNFPATFGRWSKNHEATAFSETILK